MEKKYTNPQLKKLINDFYIDNKIELNEETKKFICKSSRVRYENLLNHYNLIQINKAQENINDKINEKFNEIKNEIKEINEIIENKSEETISETTQKIENDAFGCYNKKDILMENFNLKTKCNDFKYKYENIKKEFKNFRQLKQLNINKNSLISSSDEETKEHRKIPYDKLTELSSFNIINELKKLSHHQLKTIYNRYYSNKLHRKLNV